MLPSAITCCAGVSGPPGTVGVGSGPAVAHAFRIAAPRTAAVQTCRDDLCKRSISRVVRLAGAGGRAFEALHSPPRSHPEERIGSQGRWRGGIGERIANWLVSSSRAPFPGVGAAEPAGRVARTLGEELVTSERCRANGAGRTVPVDGRTANAENAEDAENAERSTANCNRLLGISAERSV